MFQEYSNSSSISRRTLALGAAWAIPAVALAAPAPAFAASSCIPSLTSSGGLTYTWGTIGSSSTTQVLTVGAQTYVNNLPLGVTVTKVTYQWWIANRIGQDSAGPGAFWVKNSTSNRVLQSASNLPYTAGAGTAWRSYLTNTANLVEQVYPDGVTRASWDLNFDWTSGRNGSTGTYTKTSNGCQDCTTGPSGRFGITYIGVRAPSTCPSSVGTIPNFNTIIVTLSNGQTLTATVGNDGGSTCR